MQKARRQLPLHYLSQIDEEARTGYCLHCGPVRLKNKGMKGGKRQWGCRVAWEAANPKRLGARVGGTSRSYRVFVKDHCEEPACTATIKDPCQLDVHHIDGNPRNNDPANLMTLCANCHRLVRHVGPSQVNL